MRLWTCQNKEVELTGGNFNSRKYSSYYNDPSFPKAKPAYEKLWDKLGTERVLWCFTKEKDAVDQANTAEVQDQVLWELNVPENFPEDKLKIVCSITWHWIIRGGKCVPNDLRLKLKRQAYDNKLKFNEDELEKQFNSHWENKSPDQLWEMLFIDKIAEWGCSTVLLQHPVDNSWTPKKVKQL